MPLIVFTVLAFALSWASWLVLLAQGLRVAPGSDDTHLPGLMGPAIAALVTFAAFGTPFPVVPDNPRFRVKPIAGVFAHPAAGHGQAGSDATWRREAQERGGRPARSSACSRP